DAWITLKPMTGEKVVIEGTGHGPALYFYHSTCDEDEDPAPEKNCRPLYWIVEGLEVRGSASGDGDGNAVKIDTPQVTIRHNNLCCSTADVVKVVHTAHDVEISDNEIHHPRAQAGANAQGVDIVGAHNTHVLRNHVHDIPDIGMYAKGNARETVFEGNLVEDVVSNGIMLGQSTDEDRLREGPFETYDGVIRNNVIRRAGWACVATSSSQHARIEFNSCFDAGSRLHGSVLISNEAEVGQGGTRLEIRNNVFFGSAANPMIKISDHALAAPESILIDHNVYWTSAGESGATFTWRDRGLEKVSFDQWRRATHQDGASKVADPRFVDTQGLVPGAGSPAIDAAVATDTRTDRLGHTRPCGAAPDVGAYEVCPDAR
ncbi:MAG: right-handed parallel beta-helix repeat-containing protein, partial [bacterium]